jgi:beta-lactamase regulating signal transducer with metallopeptidase domain
MIPIPVEASVRAALVAVVVGLVLTVLRVRAGGVRHASWTAVLGAMLLMPVLPSWLPAIPIAVPAVTLPGSVSETLGGADAGVMPGVATRARVGAPAVAQAIRSRPVPVAAAPARSWPWMALASALWAVGALVLSSRFAGGWRIAARLAARSRPIDAERFLVPPGIALHESECVAAPATIGVWRPQIVLPIAWQTWPADKLRAVLVHEQAHVARRDTLVSFVSHVNCCLFWFHPLSWWLDRRLALASEQACDDEVVRTMGHARPYAQVLVEMAEAVRQHGGRVVWQGVGIGNCRLADRIDRLLRGDVWTTVSRTRKAVIAVACTVAIVLGVACRRPVAPLAEDPEVAQRLAKQKAASAEYKAAVEMTVQQVAALEAVVATNPDDLDATRKLLAFYRESGQKVLGWNQMVAARRPHLLRLIERHPESDLTWWPMKRSLDPVGYEQARTLWLAHVESPGVTSKTLGAAAAFFRISEKPMAERLLLRAQAMDPDGPQPRMVDNTYYEPWVARLGKLYAQAIVGSDDETLFNVVKSISLEEAQGPFASEVRKKLEDATDPRLLTAAGTYLIRNAQPATGKVGFDHIALGRSYLERARRLDPASVEPRRALMLLNGRERDARFRAAVGSPPDDAKVAALPEADRLVFLPQLAEFAFFSAENAEYYKKDTAGFEASLERARRLAEEALALAAKLAGDPRSAAVEYRANVILGAVAIRRGDRAGAVKYMRAAVEQPGSPEVAEYAQSLLRQRLVNELLKAGERASVAEFLERAAAFDEGDPPAQDAKAIREGRMPMGYQYSVTRH